jgi:hypothetical protein
MKCTEFQTRLMQEPACTEEAFLQHVSDCDSCRESYDQAMGFEALLLDAMEVDTPDELADRVLRAVNGGDGPVASAGNFRLMMAASFMLLFLVAGWMGFQWGGGVAYAEKLPQVVSQHIAKERHHLQSQGQISDASVAQLFARFGAVMRTSMGEVVFAEACWIRYQHGMHLILREASGPVTLMFMPGEDIAQEQDLVWEQSRGLIVPTDYGSLAIIASSPETADQIRRRVDGALMWGS